MDTTRFHQRDKPALAPAPAQATGNSRALSRDATPPPRPVVPILERFRAMLRDREEQIFRDAEEDDEEDDPPRPLSSEDVVPLYYDVLSELTLNSKPIITELTIIAGEQREHAAGIADAICSRILDVPVDQKLPCLYLLDSIVKNIGTDYVRHFSILLPEVFCDAYNQVPPNIRSSMRHLFGTWSRVFSSSVRHKIQSELQFSPRESHQSSGFGNVRNPESSSPHPAHGIHVNPKYLEVCHQFDCSADDIRGSNETFSGMDRYDHKRKLSSQVRDYDIDQPEAVGQSGVLGDLLPVAVGRSSALADSNSSRHRHPSPKAFPGRLNERSSRQEKASFNSDSKQIEPQYYVASEMNAIRSRELIDAYGNSKGKCVLPVKPFKIQRLEGNGINPDTTVRNWQTSEEEEYVWEDMSPTLSDRNKSNRLMPNDVNIRKSVPAAYMKKPDASILDMDLTRNNWSMHMQSSPDVPSTASDEEFGMGLTYRGPQSGMVHHHISHFTHEPLKSHYVPQQTSRSSLHSTSQERILRPSLSAADASAISHRPLRRAPPEADAQFEMPSGTHSESASIHILSSMPSSVTTDKPLAQGPTSAHIVPSTTWPSAQISHPSSTVFVTSQPRQFANRLNSTESNRPMMNQAIDVPFSSSWHPSDTFDRQMLSSGMPCPTSYQSLNPSPLNLNNQRNVPLQFPCQDPQGNIIASRSPSSYPTPTLPSQGLATFPTSLFCNQLPPQPPSFPPPRVPENSVHMPSRSLPPLPPGPPPAMHQFGGSVTNGPVGSSALPSGFSGLINSLMSQGLITLAPQTTSQDAIGVDFNPDHLKVRHESAINDLYVNLPRQCTTCGLRFNSKEEHSNHMDWHVTKNRTAKNCRQKSSRKWFVTSKEWLSGAETVGVDAVPGFLPTEAVADKIEEKELAVPADENQNLCALCGEPFEDFYSDEADEWMYKGAVYLNASEGCTKSELGPIVHAKCRSESNEVHGKAK